MKAKLKIWLGDWVGCRSIDIDFFAFVAVGIVFVLDPKGYIR
jgi:hypothetical protein